MDKDKSPGHGGGLPPPSARFSGFSANATPFNVKSESPSSSASFPLPVPAASSDSASFSHDISRMPDNPPRNRGHRRAHSEIITLPDDISFEHELGIVGGVGGPSFSDETEDDLLLMYLDIDKFNSLSDTSGFEIGQTSAAATTALAASSAPTPASVAPASSATNAVAGNNGKPRVRHQHSQSMDGSTTIEPEMLVSNSEDNSAVDSRKAMSAAKLAELAAIDPKRAKRIWANRQSAARSKERKMRYISELERRVQTLQTDATSMSAQLTILQRDTTGLNVENNELKLRVQSMEKQVHLQDALNDALKEEIQHLRVLTGLALPNGGPINYASGGGGGQQIQTHLAAQQFQQLQIRSQKKQQQHQLQHHQLFQQRQLHQQQHQFQQPQVQPQQQQFQQIHQQQQQTQQQQPAQQQEQ